MHPMRSFPPQVELRRLGNLLPVLGKANSLFKLVKCCVFCLFVKLRLSPHCVGPAGCEKKIPNDFSPGHYLVRWVRVKD